MPRCGARGHSCRLPHALVARPARGGLAESKAKKLATLRSCACRHAGSQQEMWVSQGFVSSGLMRITVCRKPHTRSLASGYISE